MLLLFFKRPFGAFQCVKSFVNSEHTPAADRTLQDSREVHPQVAANFRNTFYFPIISPTEAGLMRQSVVKQSLGMPASHITLPGLNPCCSSPRFLSSFPAKQSMIAKVLGFLSLLWETWTEFL